MDITTREVEMVALTTTVERSSLESTLHILRCHLAFLAAIGTDHRD
ncbi:MAG: hypothetical protein AB7O30_21730 [Dehalococcoidia bacterium]